MDSIRIDTGIKRIQINDGPNFIEFDPTDVAFADKFYKLIKDFDGKQADYQSRAKAISDDKELDSNGRPANIPAGLEMIREMCTFMRDGIDGVFGSGTSQTVFGDAMPLDLGMFTQFFHGITPFIQTARADKMNKYITPPVAAKRKKHVGAK